MAVVKNVTAADIYKTKLSGSTRSNDNLSTTVDTKDINSADDTPPTPSAKEPAVKTKAQYQAETLAKMQAQEADAAVVTKKVKKKIKLSKTEKKNKAKKERKEAFEKAIPKHQARKNKNKGKPKRVKLAEQKTAESEEKRLKLAEKEATKSIYKTLAVKK